MLYDAPWISILWGREICWMDWLAKSTIAPAPFYMSIFLLRATSFNTNLLWSVSLYMCIFSLTASLRGCPRWSVFNVLFRIHLPHQQHSLWTRYWHWHIPYIQCNIYQSCSIQYWVVVATWLLKISTTSSLQIPKFTLVRRLPRTGPRHRLISMRNKK